MVSSFATGTSDTDDPADDIISGCLNPEYPKSFFLYAGAGSGKTYSLVKGLESFKVAHGAKFRRSGGKIAVITYTNAACDEIIERVKGDPLFHISTIHSFCWLQIKTFHDDIRHWLMRTIPDEISELEAQEEKGRPGTQASINRQRSIANKRERLEWLMKRREFTYNPNGDNLGKASLSHSEVLKICADFLVSKLSFQQIVINRYPFLLIDESQDTNKDLIEAFFAAEERQQGRFLLGLIGDMMQRIYGDGKADLGKDIPDRWEKPIKQINRRSPCRIVTLGNDIRSEDDQHTQLSLEGKPEGYVRLFIAPANSNNKSEFEETVRQRMAEITSDELWNNPEEVKHLMLEHKMAAARMGFLEMFNALAASKRLGTALRSGDLPAVRLFSEYVFPLYKHEMAGESHAVMTLLRRAKSPLLEPSFLKNTKTGENPLAPLKGAIRAVVNLIDSDSKISFSEVLQCVAESNLFLIPHSLAPFTEKTENIIEEDEEEETEEEEKISSLEAIQHYLNTPFRQISAYKLYVSGEGAFDTHQGVKGREFERVLVVMDDEAAGGFLFSYEKMFEVKPPTKSDIDKRSKGFETGIDRTRRLFYVTCTRAEKSLALVAYSQNPALLKQRAIAKGWFHDHEIIQ